MKPNLQELERLKALDQLLTLVPPKRLSKNIRVLLLEYLQHNSHDLPDDFPTMLHDVNNLFEMLDKVEAA